MRAGRKVTRGWNRHTASAPVFEAKTPFAKLMQKHVEKTARSNEKPLSLEDVRRQVRKLRTLHDPDLPGLGRPDACVRRKEVRRSDACHIATSYLLGADEFITTEKVSKPVHQNTLVHTVSITE